MKIIRWCITETGSEMGGLVSVEASIANDFFPVDHPDNFDDIVEDNLDWWGDVVDGELDDQFAEQRFGPFRDNHTFLQVIEDDEYLDEVWPDLESSLALDSDFVNYTGPSRAQAKEMYKKLLGEQ